MGRRIARWGLFATMLALVGCDHATKLAAESALGQRGPLELVPGVLDLRLAHNDDTAFSLLRDVELPHRGLVFAIVPLLTLALVLLFAWRRRNSASFVERIAFALVTAGALGNVVDRVRRGYVIDFIHVSHWPVFNVADVIIAIGGIMLAIAGLRRHRAPPGDAPAP